MKCSVALFCLPVLLGAAHPAPLIAGAVRDQLGDPVEGAIVRADGARAVTDAAGTFALRAQAVSVEISCAYCRTTRAAVDSDGTVTAVIRRYRAISDPGPTHADLQSLPYADAERALSLTPFVVLNDSTSVLPGPQLSLYGISRFGGLVVDDGIPAYDIASGATPLRTLPAFGVVSASVRDHSQAFRYGDMAAAGSFFFESVPRSGTAATAAAGNPNGAAVAQRLRGWSYDAAASGYSNDTRLRADVAAAGENAGFSLSGNALAARDAYETEYGGSADSSVTAIRAHAERAQSLRTYADVEADRSGYAARLSSSLPIAGQWSDVSVQAGASGTGAVSAFADAGLRASAALYDASAAGAPRVAGTVYQLHVSAGAQGAAGALHWLAGIGAFDVAYDGGTLGRRLPLAAQILAPSASVTYAIGAHWTLDAQAGGSFRLPALTEAYVRPAQTAYLAFDRYATESSTLSYTDLRRVRVSMTALARKVSNLDTGTATAAGLSVAWQIAPDVSLRAWTLHVDDATRPYAPVFRFGAAPLPATPASLWTTYENPSGLRIDAMWRRDLLDYRPDVHLDASISAPAGDGLRWFAGTERRYGRRGFVAGVRLDRP